MGRVLVYAIGLPALIYWALVAGLHIHDPEVRMLIAGALGFAGLALAAN